MSIHHFKVDKLIRDKLPQLLTPQGITMLTRIMEEPEYQQRLRDKLVEEAREVAQSTTRQELIEELGDVLEVVQALCAAYNIPYSTIEHTRLSKREAKGGFDSKLYCSHMSVDESSPHYAKYKARPNEYPEIDVK